MPAATVITVSDRAARGEREDVSGALARSLLEAAGYAVSGPVIVADERRFIADTLRLAAVTAQLVVTTGGTGFGPRDVTPEATRDVLEREAPGLPELLRAEGRARTPMAALSRGVAGTIGSALVVNLPGSPAGVRDGLAILLPLVPRARSSGRTYRFPLKGKNLTRPAGRR